MDRVSETDGARAGGRLGWLATAPVGLVVLLAVGVLFDATTIGFAARENLFDFYQRLAPRAPISGERAGAPRGAVFIAIDDASLDRFGPWPWPRTRLADLVETANASGAAAVAFDAPVTGLDPLSPENAGRIWLERKPDAGLAAKLAETPRHDAVFAKVLKAAPSLLSLEATPNAAAAEAPPPRTPVTVQEGRLQDLALPQKGAAEAPPSILGAAASDIAVRTLTPDRDGVLRRAPTVWIVDRAVRPSLALGAARLALGAPKAVIDVEADRFWVSSRAASGVTLGVRRSPTLADASLRLHAPKSTAPRTISAATLLRSPGEAARSLQGRVA
ncbi:MAG: CHASE2 domain-containing protein, partial [Pseudomonadota bacterium]